MFFLIEKAVKYSFKGISPKIENIIKQYENIYNEKPQYLFEDGIKICRDKRIIEPKELESILNDIDTKSTVIDENDTDSDEEEL